jgi:cytoskeletal protein RodZ
MLFETKKVPLETLGEYLKEIREQIGLSVKEVVDKTGICDKYLINLEEGKYHHLPPDVYVYGFLKKLAEAYAVPAATLIEQYKRERGIVEQVASKAITPQKGLKAKLAQLVITPKIITLFSGVGLAVIALLYLVVQVSAINRTPDLKVAEPAPGSVVKESFVNVSGQTDPGTTLAINGQNVFVDNEGKFKTTMSVAEGQTELAVVAQNKFGKTATEKILVMVDQPKAKEAARTETEARPQVLGASTDKPSLNLELKFSQKTTITINTDDGDVITEVVPANSIKKVTAEEKIILRTSDAGSTTATLNGKSLGKLGRSKESLTIPFTAESLTEAD